MIMQGVSKIAEGNAYAYSKSCMFMQDREELKWAAEEQALAVGVA
jgi:hypothetical protein